MLTYLSTNAKKTSNKSTQIQKFFTQNNYKKKSHQKSTKTKEESNQKYWQDRHTHTCIDTLLV